MAKSDTTAATSAARSNTGTETPNSGTPQGSRADPATGGDQAGGEQAGSAPAGGAPADGEVGGKVTAADSQADIIARNAARFAAEISAVDGDDVRPSDVEGDFRKLAKRLGIDPAKVYGFNRRRTVVVTVDGQKLTVA